MTYWTNDGANASTGAGEKQERYTPDYIVDDVREFFGGCIELDPCSPGAGLTNVIADRHFTKDDNGLALPWDAASVFVNPPYGRGSETGIEPWIRKAIYEYDEGNAGEVILLVPCRTDTAWFDLLSPYPRVEVYGRIPFDGLDKNGKPLTGGAPFPSALFYLGFAPAAFIDAFQHYGRIVIDVRHLEHLGVWRL